MSKRTATFTIDSKILDAFEKSKGYFKKSTLVSFWINQFLENRKEFVPPQDKQGDNNLTKTEDAT